jgi:hypothetical protein
MSTGYPKFDGDPAFTVRGAYGSPRPVVADDPDEQLEALNKRAGEILTERGVVAATTQQLMDAVALAERDIGVTYDEIRARQRGEVPVLVEDPSTVSVLGAPMALDPESVRQDLRVRAHLAARGLTLEDATQEDYLQALEDLGVSA